MNKSSITILVIVSLCFLALLTWEVFDGYKKSKVSFEESIELVLKDNRLTNQVFLSGYKQRLGDIATHVGRTGFVPAYNSQCETSSDESCLLGLLTVSADNSTLYQSRALDCGQIELIDSLKGAESKVFEIGPTKWISTGTVMAPIAHMLPNMAGWMAACVNVDPIRKFWRELELPDKTSMALVRASDFRLWVREPFKPELLGRDLSDGPLVAAMVAQGIDSNGIADITATKTDFVQRTVQWSPINVSDLVLVVGYPKAHFTESWTQSEAHHLTILAILCTAFTALAVFAYSRISNQFREVSKLAKRLSIATSGGGIGVFEYDFNNDYLDWNDEMFRIFGIEQSTFTNKFEDWRNLLHPNEASSIERSFLKARESNETFKSDFRFLKPDGHEGWVFIVAEFSDIEDGMANRALGISMDVSERQNVNSLLREAKREAEEANRAKSQFLASMSHELRTPLNAVLGFAQMLEMDPKQILTEQYKSYLSSILEGGNYLLVLVNEVLDLSKIEANQMHVKVEEIDANVLIKECVELSQPLTIANDISLIAHQSEAVFTFVRTDQIRLKQVLLNLLSNAIRYNKSGGKVSIEMKHTPQGYLRIFVRDTGIGIPNEDHGQVFKMFHRLGSDAYIAQEGTGIGLNVSKLIIERLGGAIGFESAEGKGSTFWLDVPLATNAYALVWGEHLYTGIDELDNDHQRIVLIYNRVIHNNLPLSELDEALHGLVEYMKSHFQREETVMKICEYPGYDKHKAEHDELLRRVDELCKFWDETHSKEEQDHLRELMKDLWVKHFVELDFDMARYTVGKEKLIVQALDDLPL
ncbi:ATP-binding protein [Magnetovibrio sp. PR-2]|uniref:ATP-binding protein n=1 Tax=Magnetovibrio sp. PR-2 TaxID=3120356 RepID=UPI002FCE10FB